VRRAIGLLLLVAVVLVVRHSRAEDTPVPIGLQAELLAKVAAYDRNLPRRAGDRVRILLLQKPGDADSARVVSQMKTIKADHVAIVFFTPGFADDVEAIRRALVGVDVLSATAVPDYVPRGVVLGFDLVGGKPKLLVNLTQAGKQNVAFMAEVLKMMKVYE
jgi:hypothetical protein